MDKSTILEQLSKFLKNEMNVSKEVGLESDIKDDLHIDSLSMMDLIFYVETLVGDEIPLEEIEEIKTIEDIVNYVAKKSEVA